MVLIFLQKAYVFAFLLSARLFIPPSELLARVCELCIKQQQLDQSPLDTVSTAPHVNVAAEAMWATLLSSSSSQIHVFSLTDPNIMFPLWEFLLNTGRRNFTGTVSLTWPSRWSCLHCGVGSLCHVTMFHVPAVETFCFSFQLQETHEYIKTYRIRNATAFILAEFPCSSRKPLSH